MLPAAPAVGTSPAAAELAADTAAVIDAAAAAAAAPTTQSQSEPYHAGIFVMLGMLRVWMAAGLICQTRSKRGAGIQPSYELSVPSALRG